MADIKNWKFFILIITTFYSLAIILAIVMDTIFYLFNFMLIGTALACGLGLWPVFSKKKKRKARMVSQFLVGGYLFFGLGCGTIYLIWGYWQPENMQLAGFWFYSLAGIFGAASMHYIIAKIIGPLLFNRGWCGWACWSAAIFDLLPWKKSPGRKPKLGILRFVFFILISGTIFILIYGFNYSLSSIAGIVDRSSSFDFESPHLYDSIWKIPELWWFIIGNVVYYTAGIILAYILKDNRAFCKYLCPISVFMKTTSRAALVKIKIDNEKCTQCGACERACLMDIQLISYAKDNKRILSTECIQCMNCVAACPVEAVNMSTGFDFGYKERLNCCDRKEENL
ncbi:4Fe-4S binding protein [Candidatus Lokiarchaeum ossiferum]|uniref:4Fe-4S binding protein n=1 Tax=Candidatus Lokiarchaeum ossiferum TaxID=2951803 RepID=UPI00352E1075